MFGCMARISASEEGLDSLNLTYKVLRSRSVLRFSSSLDKSPEAIAILALTFSSFVAFDTGLLDFVMPPSKVNKKLENDNKVNLSERFTFVKLQESWSILFISVLGRSGTFAFLSLRWLCHWIGLFRFWHLGLSLITLTPNFSCLICIWFSTKIGYQFHEMKRNPGIFSHVVFVFVLS